MAVLLIPKNEGPLNFIENYYEHLDNYKVSILFNKLLKSFGSLYFPPFSMKSIYHTFGSFGTT